MELPEQAKRLRIVVGEHDHHGPIPLYEWIVVKAREFGLAGATVTKGVMGYGGSGRLHRNEIYRVSTDDPVVIEITDTEEKIRRMLPLIEESVQGGLATIEDVLIVHHSSPTPELETAH
ncbi:MAG: DUF190 domain-containing protein [Opitutaceae bacterium]